MKLPILALILAPPLGAQTTVTGTAQMPVSEWMMLMAVVWLSGLTGYLVKMSVSLRRNSTEVQVRERGERR